MILLDKRQKLAAGNTCRVITFESDIQYFSNPEIRNDRHSFGFILGVYLWVWLIFCPLSIFCPHFYTLPVNISPAASASVSTGVGVARFGWYRLVLCWVSIRTSIALESHLSSVTDYDNAKVMFDTFVILVTGFRIDSVWFENFSGSEGFNKQIL